MSVKRKKKRIYVRVPEEVYYGLAEMQKAGGYRSVCSLAHALLTQLVARYGDGEQRERPPVSDEEQIAEMKAGVPLAALEAKAAALKAKLNPVAETNVVRVIGSSASGK